MKADCWYCGKEGATKMCYICKHRHYCNKECQTKDWKKHKIYCTPRIDCAFCKRDIGYNFNCTKYCKMCERKYCHERCMQFDYKEHEKYCQIRHVNCSVCSRTLIYNVENNDKDYLDKICIYLNEYRCGEFPCSTKKDETICDNCGENTYIFVLSYTHRYCLRCICPCGKVVRRKGPELYYSKVVDARGENVENRYCSLKCLNGQRRNYIRATFYIQGRPPIKILRTGNFIDVRIRV